MKFPRMLDLLAYIAKLLTGTQAIWKGSRPNERQRVYFANHTSNMDTIVIWSALPSYLRNLTRPVAAKDYWDKPGLRRRIATKELNVVLIERNKEDRSEDPLNPLRRALDEGSSLIIFPEGKRNAEVVPGEFKSGIYKLFREYPEVEFIPVYLENVAKTFPRGALFPLPIICKAWFGSAIEFTPEYEDDKRNMVDFLNVARRAVIELVPEHIKLALPDFDKQVQVSQSVFKEKTQ